MFPDINLTDTPDFVYQFEEVVKLPEFELYHLGQGLYRLARPQYYCDSDFNLLQEKYVSLRFYYIAQETNARADTQIKLLFVMSREYNRCRMEQLLFFQEERTGDAKSVFLEELAAIFPKGYDTDIDRILNGEFARIELIDARSYCGPAARIKALSNRLLGFRWNPDRYHDLSGNRIYIMYQGYVAKRIAEGVYAFQCVREYGDQDLEYPYIFHKIYSQRYKRCAVLGKPFVDWERTGIYIRYIAFDDNGIRTLRKLYQYTVGYEYREVAVETDMNEKDGVRSDIASALDKKEKHAAGKSEQDLEEKRNAYCFRLSGEHIAELVRGAGYRDLILYCRLLPGTEDKTEGCKWLQYDISYFEVLRSGSNVLKLIDIDGQNVIECNILTETIAELDVVVKTEICAGVEENILIKVIDHTDIEKAMAGAGSRARLLQAVEHIM